MCGDYDAILLKERFCRDTTPRVRGLLDIAGKDSTCPRYNPACAGTTCVLRDICRDKTIQPRVCGDYSRQRTEDAGKGDTTPRVRGLLLRVDELVDELRYNPACAGTTKLPMSV